jgi:hypothetical protein
MACQKIRNWLSLLWTKSPVTQQAGTPASTARWSIWRASLGLVANPTVCRVPAAWQCWACSVQERGRYRTRSKKAWPRAAA